MNILRPKREEVTCDQRKLRNGKLHGLHLHQSEKDKLGRILCGTYRPKEKFMWGFGGKTSRKEATWKM
jgi:hypothetical protein